MRISQMFLQQLKDRCDIEHLISPYVALRRRGGSLVGLCPFHSEKTPSFTVFPATQSYYCFGCGAGGDIITFIRSIEHLDYLDAIRFLAEKAGLEMPEEEQDDHSGRERERTFQINQETARFYHSCLMSEAGKPALQYLLDRKITMHTIKHFGLGYAPGSWGLVNHLTEKGFTREEILTARVASKGKTGSLYDYFRNRVMYPIIDVRGKVIAFGGRVMDDSQPKYLNSPDTPVFKKSNHLFALNFAKSGSTEAMILAEGYMDVIALHQAGFTSAIATLGTAITEQQARLISRYSKLAVISYDSDEAGKKATQRAIGLLNEAGVEVKVLSIPDAKDPDEYIKKFGADRFRLLLQKSDSYVDFQLEKIKSQYHLEEESEKVKYIEDATRMLCEIPNPIEREVYAGKLAKETGISKENLMVDITRRLKMRVKRDEKKLIGLQQTGVTRSRDEVNPEKNGNLKAALAEERLLCLLFYHPDFYQRLSAKLRPENFVTGFNRRVYQAFSELLERGESIDLNQFSEKFTVPEMGYLAKYLTLNETMAGTLEEMEDYIHVIREASDQLSKDKIVEADPEKLQEYIKQRRNKQEGGNNR